MANKPTARIVQNSGVTKTVTDELGRTLVFRKLSPLERFDVYTLLGSDRTENKMTLAWGFVTSAIVSIDSVPMLTPQNEMQLRANISAIGEEGFAVGFAVVNELLFPKPTEEITVEVKNS